MKDLINIRLEEIRKEHKLSRKGLEEISGFKARTIESYERGQNPPSKEYIEFICLFFGYSINFINGKDSTLLNDFKRVINIFQSIFNYDDEKMAELLNISLEEYKNKYNYLTCEHTISKKLDENFLLLEKLNIKPSSISLTLNEMELKKIFFTVEIKNLENRFLTLETNGLNITPEYYALIIKQRNQPEIITPDTQKESIPDKYKEILELLPYASDSFIQNLKNKLLELKKAQQIEDL